LHGEAKTPRWHESRRQALVEREDLEASESEPPAPGPGSGLLTGLLAALRSLLYASGFVLLWWWVVVSVRPFDLRIPFTLPEWLRLPGLILLVGGAVLVLWCLAAFSWEGKGTPAPFDAPRQVVVTGPYRYVRNPMYLGAMLIILGVALMLRSPSAVGVAVCFITLAHLFVLVYEEPALKAQFGESYSEYKRSVNRWLPRVPRTPGRRVQRSSS